MAAIRVVVPPEVASSVWLAHIVRNATLRALADRLDDPAVVRIEIEEAGGQETRPKRLSGEVQAKQGEQRKQVETLNERLKRGVPF